MTTCPRCRGINFDDGCLYALGSVGFMLKSALAGCPGCDYFLTIARRELEESQDEEDTNSSDEDSSSSSDGQSQDAGLEGSENSTDDTEQKLFIEQRPELQVLLQKYSADSNRVDLNFVVEGPSMGIAGYVQLRLCTANGVEVAPWAEFEGKNTGGLGRLIAKDSADEQCLDLAKSWLARCTRYHGSQCALQTHVELPTRLIYVPAAEDSMPELVHTGGQKGQYVTLSYCWGYGGACKTTPLNLEERKRGIPLEEMPKTLRDAIDLVRRMGVEWIWIDALCILQEEANLEDWTHESSLMAQVYGRSLFTICVDWASSTDIGIFGERKVMNSHQFGPNGDYQLQSFTRGWGSSMIGQALYSRGWAFQERILSTRNIHFLEKQIAWECNTTIYLEGVRGRQSDRGSHFGKSIVTKHTRRDIQKLNTPPLRPSDLDIWNRIVAWNAFVVQEMSVRSFTHESDRLPAVSGLATAFEIPELGEYFAGVWSWNPFLTMAYWGAEDISAKDKRVPSWTGIGAHWLIRWAVDHEKDDDVTPWEVWDKKYGPRLIEKQMVYPSETPDPKGRVLEGSHLVMTGFCRTVYVRESPGATFENAPMEEERDSEDAHQPGVVVAMDVRNDNHASAASFLEDLSDVKEASDDESSSEGGSSSGDGEPPESAGGPDAESEEEDEVKSYLCVQLQHRREKRRYPKIFALLLERLEGEDEDSYQRVGIVAFDAVEDEEAWVKRTLKLF